MRYESCINIYALMPLRQDVLMLLSGNLCCLFDGHYLMSLDALFIVIYLF